MAPNPFDELTHDVDSAAEFTGLSRSTIRNYVRQGRLPAIRLGKYKLRFRQADLLALATPVAASDGPLDAAVERIVAGAPELSSAQRDRLATLLRSEGARQR